MAVPLRNRVVPTIIFVLVLNVLILTSRQTIFSRESLKHMKIIMNDDAVLLIDEKKVFKFEYENPVHKFPLPDWMDKFLRSQPIDTHNETLADLNEKFIVLTCHKFKGSEDEACGGISDRLRDLPYYVWLANHTGRKLLIKYSKPHPLEEFFVPPKEGLDWRLPDEYVATEWAAYANRTFQEYRKQRRTQWHQYLDKSPWKEQRFIFANTNIAQIREKTFKELSGLSSDDVFPGIFRRMFRPSKALGKAIDDLADQHLGFVPGQYGVSHIRAKYPKAGLGNGKNFSEDLERLGDTALKCVVKAMPYTQYIFVATDSHQLLDYILFSNTSSIQTGENKNNITVITRPNYHKPSLHFDQRNYGRLKGTASPEEFFSLFIDLWMLAHSKCVSQGLGGFAHFGSQLSGNHLSCRVRHKDKQLGLLESCPTPAELKKMKMNG